MFPFICLFKLAEGIGVRCRRRALTSRSPWTNGKPWAKPNTLDGLGGSWGGLWGILGGSLASSSMISNPFFFNFWGNDPGGYEG